MGDWYDVVWLAGVPYIEYSNDSTDWRPTAKQMTKEQYKALEDLRNKHCQDEQKLLKGMTDV